MVAAVAESRLALIPDERIECLLSGSHLAQVPTGTILRREGDEQPHLDLVVAGVVRAFVTAPDGRTMTVRYCRTGELLGAMSLFADDFILGASIQALVETLYLRIPPAQVKEAAGRDPRVAGVFLSELSERAQRFLEEIPDVMFTTVRQRLVRHLLDLAAQDIPEHGTGEAPHLVVATSQADLANAVGSVREVVVRELRELREDGAIATSRRGIVILDPAGMLQRNQGS